VSPDRARELQERLLVTFRTEASEHLGVLGRELEALDCESPEEDRRARLELLFRTMHTLKGAARSVGLTDIESLCHLSEAMLRSLRETAAVTPEIVRVLQETCDAVGGLLSGGLAAGRLEAISAQLQRAPEVTARAPTPPARIVGVNAVPEPNAPEAASPEPPSQQSPPPKPVAPSGVGTDTIRVEIERLDLVNTLAEELLVPKLASLGRVQMARSLLLTLSQLRAKLRSQNGNRGTALNGPNGAPSNAIDHGLRIAEAACRQMVTALRNDHKVLRASVDALLDEIRRIRLMPAAPALEAFPRMVRDIARDTGKDVAWKVTGADIELDRKVLELIKDPLIHMVRNAIDHGIEKPQDRVAIGKPPQGTIALAIEPAEGGRVTITVRDDGRGLDLDAIKSAAVRARVASDAQVAALGDGDVAELALRPGVSTSPVISSISGNGVGLTIVRERIERVEGRMSMTSVPGHGTTIRLDLPTTIATSRGLLVGVGGRRVLWPFDAVERAIAVPVDQIEPSLARGTHTYRDEALPIGRLGAIMGYDAPASNIRRLAPAIVVRNAGRRGILLVDEVLGESEIVVKELRAPLRRVRNVMTTGLLGTGELVLVARPSDVLASIRGGRRSTAKAAVTETSRVLRILIVDDSITTRTMERNMFEAAGYQVRTAADGVDALSALQDEPFDLVVSDVDMPRMDGFEFTAQVRANEQFAQLPIVLVTALESREDKERGVRVGANAYVLKSGFNQSNLLEIVRRLT
jgi:two-component system, chemotaxis family, sensor kinase CheA